MKSLDSRLVNSSISSRISLYRSSSSSSVTVRRPTHHKEPTIIWCFNQYWQKTEVCLKLDSPTISKLRYNLIMLLDHLFFLCMLEDFNMCVLVLSIHFSCLEHYILISNSSQIRAGKTIAQGQKNPSIQDLHVHWKFYVPALCFEYICIADKHNSYSFLEFVCNDKNNEMIISLLWYHDLIHSYYRHLYKIFSWWSHLPPLDNTALSAPLH